MYAQTDFRKCILLPLDKQAATEISQWEYPEPYAPYSIKGHDDEYLWDQTSWGTEQFYLALDGQITGQVSCQLEGNHLWVGWSMAPILCGCGYGASFVAACVDALRQQTQHHGPILLRVAAWNIRAIRAYKKAGFRYVETIQDEIAYSNHMEDFWVMELK